MQGDPTRATPAPGEKADVTWHVGFPGARQPMGWFFLACRTVNLGVPVCADAPFAVVEHRDPSIEDPTYTLALPPASDFGANDTHVLLLGAVCFGGAPPAVDEVLAGLEAGTPLSALGCEDPRNEGQFASYRLLLANADEAGEPGGGVNHNPSIARVAVDGELWESDADPTAPVSGCVGSGVRELSASAAPQRLQVFVSSSDFEPFIGEDIEGVRGRRLEQLQVSWTVTAGALQRPFSFLEGATFASQDWTLPPAAAVPPGGLLVRFEMVVRDSDERAPRGGTDWVSRALCLVR